MYYDDILERLVKGKKVADVEDEDKFRCINAVVHQDEFVWERISSLEMTPTSTGGE